LLLWLGVLVNGEGAYVVVDRRPEASNGAWVRGGMRWALAVVVGRHAMVEDGWSVVLPIDRFDEWSVVMPIARFEDDWSVVLSINRLVLVLCLEYGDRRLEAVDCLISTAEARRLVLVDRWMIALIGVGCSGARGESCCGLRWCRWIDGLVLSLAGWWIVVDWCWWIDEWSLWLEWVAPMLAGSLVVGCDGVAGSTAWCCRSLDGGSSSLHPIDRLLVSLVAVGGSSAWSITVCCDGVAG
jgi:hypothetical protein